MIRRRSKKANTKSNDMTSQKNFTPKLSAHKILRKTNDPDVTKFMEFVK